MRTPHALHFSMIPFWKIIPGGNPTILLRASDVPEAMRAAAAEAIMSPMHLCAEQVGYIDIGRRRIDMMGGEFCVNASRAFSLLLAACGALEKGGDGWYEGGIHASGYAGLLRVKAREQDTGSWQAEICLEFPSLPSPEPLSDGSALFRLPGIAHIIESGPLPEDLPAFCRAQRARCGLEEEKAVGHIWIDALPSLPGSSPDLPAHRITPVVWVRGTDSLCRETACGSGTLAAALHLLRSSSCRDFRIGQPSGSTLDVRFLEAPCGWEAWVGGPAWEAAHGETSLAPADGHTRRLIFPSMGVLP